MYTVERTNKAEIRPEEQSEKIESCGENLWNEIQLKGHKERHRHKNRTKRNGRARLVYASHKPQHPHHVKVNPRELQSWVQSVLLVSTSRCSLSYLCPHSGFFCPFCTNFQVRSVKLVTYCSSPFSRCRLSGVVFSLFVCFQVLPVLSRSFQV